jgi:hypothetical protein
MLHLGFTETIRWLEEIEQTCHPGNRELIEAKLLLARKQEGQTLFDIIVDIIRDHGPAGTQAKDGVDLELL